MDYRIFLTQISEDRRKIKKEREELLSSNIQEERVKGAKMLPQLQKIITLQDSLINYVATIENKKISEVRDEFDFTY